METGKEQLLWWHTHAQDYVILKMSGRLCQILSLQRQIQGFSRGVEYTTKGHVIHGRPPTWTSCSLLLFTAVCLRLAFIYCVYLRLVLYFFLLFVCD